MPLTLGDVKASLQARGYGTDTDTAQTTFVTDALRRIYGMRRWRFLQFGDLLETSAGSEFVLMTDEYRRIEQLRVTVSADEEYVLERVDLKDLHAARAADPTQDVPLQWAYADSSGIELWPTPNRVYTVTINYAYIPSMPADDADILVFPEEHLEVLVSYSAMLMSQRQRDWQAYNAAKAEWQEALTDMIRSHTIAAPGYVERWDGWEQVAR